MKNIILAATILITACTPLPKEMTEVELWQATANKITITRDNWGIPHIYGPTDADAVFGMIYAQAEDDFNRIEVNFLNAMGRLAEAEGESEIYRDLRMKLFIRPDEIKAMYKSSPPWLKKLMNAWADGLNYYLHTHPEVKPKVLTRFEPWMALTFSEGSIGGDIERARLNRLENFYGDKIKNIPDEKLDLTREPQGSNGFAIAPKNTASGNAMLLINPHTSFYFRSELHMQSDEGLNAYGAVTWGQFFVYQGFNEKNGWMHTSTGADFIDEYLETVEEREDGVYYLYDDKWRKMTSSVITIPYKTISANGKEGMASKQFTAYHSHHGPIIRAEGDKWVAMAIMESPMKALIQSYERTKTDGLVSFKKNMEYHTNSSNNTVYADADGNIGFFHGNFIPKRDPNIDWTKPVDGSTSATEWQGLHSVDESINQFNPDIGWLQNTNNWPFSMSGSESPKKSDYPQYMSTFGENPRGIHAIRVLENTKNFTLDSLISAAYDSYLTAFEPLIPLLLSAYDNANNEDKVAFADSIALLRTWDLRFAVDSVPTSVAIYWGRELMRASSAPAREANMDIYDYMENKTSATQKLDALQAGLAKLTSDFGKWDMPWGEINRFQRLTSDIVQPFDDNKPSVPVALASARWGSLAAFGQRTFNDSKKNYGTRGNSFVAVVEFGDKVKAKAITAGGQSGDINSPHFADQIIGYANGTLRDVYFYNDDIKANAEETYQPGSRVITKKNIKLN
ncbi:penicillin acylase family protein [Pseudoalteromonas sp. SCSIO 43088]|uniref:penicillin acylase family protein n=1 Tax=Pseudoalteromonas sp. SCSIO 43088 TaxID=2822846 RepID=UPI00202AF55A|nr:penicillin acylase family protein [Pseudoalteromonas sp. SCSIO 43088]URQ85214.1 penicillin acylase family protein [Pseudoalteromonas sp. SCSIO 43088]